MDTYQKYIADSLEMGFSYAVLLRDLTLTCSPDLRAYCNADSCANYGKTWVCPPGCGTLESCQNQISKYCTGIVLQSVSEIPASTDKLTKLQRLNREHNSRFLRLSDIARRDGYSVLPLTTGGCIICETCTFPDIDCREPERRMHSLSAYGINVGELCKKAGLEYAFTEGIVYYTACLMLSHLG